MAVLVTGASGFLGGRLTQILAGQGEQVTILDRGRSDLRHLGGLAGIRVVPGSLSDTPSLQEAARDVTHIFHCAAACTDWAPAEVFLASNFGGTENLLLAAGQARHLQRFVHISTTDVYGYPKIPCAETGALRDAGLPYNRTKIAAENAVWRAARGGLPVTVIRPATIYGPRGKAFVQGIAELLQKGQMSWIAGGRTTGGFLYVDNAVDGILLAARTPEAQGEAYNLADGTTATWRDYVTALAAALGSRPPRIDLPWLAAMALACGMEAAHRSIRALPGRPLLTRHAVLLLGRDQEFPAEKARRQLGFVPRVCLEDGIARSSAWLKSLP